MMKEDLMRQIKAKESELERERLMQEIKVKESELQELLVGVERTDPPPPGTWRIQSQVLDGKEIPEGEWILPGTQIIRNHIATLKP